MTDNAERVALSNSDIDRLIHLIDMEQHRQEAGGIGQDPGYARIKVALQAMLHNDGSGGGE